MKKYECQIYNAKQSFIYCLIIWILFMAFSALLSILLRVQAIFPVAFVCSVLLPYLFEKKIKAFFTKRIFLVFEEEAFSISICGLLNDEIIKHIVYSWSDIKCYKFYFTPSKLTYLDIYLKDGSFKEFGFKDNKTEEESTKEESVFSIFYSYVNEYNINKTNSEKIIPAIGFLATKLGSAIMCIIFVLIIVAIILSVIKNSYSIGFLIGGASIFFTLLTKRKSDKAFYNKIMSVK